MKVTEIEKLKQLVSRTDMSGNEKVEWLTDFIDKHVTEQLRLNDVRSSFTHYTIFEISEKGIVKMVYTADEDDERDHSFKTKEEAHEWLIKNAKKFRRYFIMEQVTVY